MSSRLPRFPVERLNPDFRSWCERYEWLLMAAYRSRITRPLVRIVLDRFDGGYMLSRVWRRIFREIEGVELGVMSRGAGLKPGTLPKGTKVGNFSCLGKGLLVLRRNHTFHRISQHPVFFNRILGLVAEDTIAHVHQNRLRIGSDVWFGLNVTICPGCSNIGDGAIIGVGAVVTKDVPPFAIVAGNPARVIRKRFEPAIEQLVAASEWWLQPPSRIIEHSDLFMKDVDETTIKAFAAAFPPGDPQRKENH